MRRFGETFSRRLSRSSDRSLSAHAAILQLHCTAPVSIRTMATLHAIPRFLLPRGPLLLRPQARPLLPFPSTTNLRYASTNPKTLSEQFKRRQTPVIPQPDKYRPPSHGKRTPRSETTQRSYGPALTAEDRERMRTKKYPNMMSPEGTFSHWFLNNRSIHLWITMVRDLSAALVTEALNVCRVCSSLLRYPLGI